jgi:hypothetical protein
VLGGLMLILQGACCLLETLGVMFALAFALRTPS